MLLIGSGEQGFVPASAAEEALHLMMKSGLPRQRQITPQRARALTDDIFI